MDKFISHNLSIFLKGRLLVYGVVVVNEETDLAKRYKKTCLIMKVDFEKAYDLFSLNYLYYMLMRFVLNEKWRSWMRSCLFFWKSSGFGQWAPIQDISIQRGLEKGDPLTSFIFLLVAEGLCGLVYRVVELGIYFGFRVRSFKFMVSHLLYTYDTLILVIPTIDIFLILRSSLGVLSSLQIFKSIFLKACSLGLMLTCFFGICGRFSPFQDLISPITWDPLVNLLTKRLYSKKHKYVSFSCEMVLLYQLTFFILILF